MKASRILALLFALAIPSVALASDRASCCDQQASCCPHCPMCHHGGK